MPAEVKAKRSETAAVAEAKTVCPECLRDATKLLENDVKVRGLMQGVTAEELNRIALSQVPYICWHR